jgi:hypothetical protein
MESRLSKSGSKGYIALSLWLFVACIFFSLAWQWISFSNSDKELTEYVESLLRRSSIDHRPSHDIRTLVQLKAEQLSLPVQTEEISVTGQGESLQTTFAYGAEIKIPLLNRALYRMEFNHDVRVKTQF